MSAADDFWRWSLEVYGRPGAADAFLALQDVCGLNVNVSLWCLWTGVAMGDLPEARLLAAQERVARQSALVTEHLRTARRNCGSTAAGVPPALADALRVRIKATELEAERVEQAILCGLLDERSDAPGSGSETAARRNLARYARLAGASARTGFSVALLDAVIDASFPSSDQGDRGSPSRASGSES